MRPWPELLPETISAGWRNDLGENGGRVAQDRCPRGAAGVTVAIARPALVELT